MVQFLSDIAYETHCVPYWLMNSSHWHACLYETGTWIHTLFSFCKICLHTISMAPFETRFGGETVVFPQVAGEKRLIRGWVFSVHLRSCRHSNQSSTNCWLDKLGGLADNG